MGNPHSPTSDPRTSIPGSRPSPCYACLYRPPAGNTVPSLVAIAQEFSPRYERHGDDLVSIDVSGLDRLLGRPRTIGEEIRREASARGMRVNVAVAAARMAALVLAQARPGLTVVEPGEEAAALAPVPIGILEKIHGHQPQSPPNSQNQEDQRTSAISAISAVKRWGVKTLGELAALPPADLSARLGKDGLLWRAIARGEDTRPLVPDVPEERFESSIELDWPIEGLEPLSFVLTRLLEPIALRLERRDRGAAVLHVVLRLVTCPSARSGRAGAGHGELVEPCESHVRRLDLPAPIRDVRTLRTLALLDLESHPPPAAIDGVTVVIDPTPGRVLQHRLFTRAHPTPEQLSTLLARLGALMGVERIGAPARVDSYRPGAFEMRSFATDHEHHDPAHDDHRDHDDHRRDRKARREFYVQDSAVSASSAVDVVSALRRCRQPVPARVAVDAGRPVRVTTDRRSFAGGAVLQLAGPWRTSGHWWEGRAGTAGGAGQTSDLRLQTSRVAVPPWDRDEWDVALSDGAVYRIVQDRETGGWFIDAVVD